MKIFGALLAIILLLRAIVNFATFSLLNLVVALVYIALGIFVILNKKEASIFVIILSVVGVISAVLTADYNYAILSDLILLGLAIFNLRD